MTTLAELMKARSPDELKAELLAMLASEDFPVTDWHEGGVERTLVEVDATVLSSLDATIAQIAQGGYLDTAGGAWLTLYAAGRYGLDRKLAQFEVQAVELTDAASSGPHTFQPGQLWAMDASGLRYQNVTGGSLALGGTLSLHFRAEQPGLKYHVSPGTITTLVTSIPGVTITNTGTVDNGTDDETDPALRQRCRDRWGELGTGSTAAAYRNWAQAASEQVTRVSAAPGALDDGTVDVLIAGTGALDPSVVSDVQAYIDERAPLTAKPVVASVRLKTIKPSGVVYVAQGYDATAEAQGKASLNALANETPIGGAYISASRGVALSEIIERLMTPDGVRNVVLAGSDTLLDPDEVPVFDFDDLSWQTVA